MVVQRLLAGTAAVVLVGVLAACAPEPEPVEAEPTVEPTPTETASGEPEPVARTFTLPVDCTEILPASRVEAFSADNLQLLGGPGSVYGNEYFFEATPEQLAGGITCVYADEADDLSSIAISVAPISPATRPGIITDLTGQGLNEDITDDGAVTYSQQGDEQGLAPAILNVVTQESWISIISVIGGPASFERAQLLADEVDDSVYR
jgi:hypothetical protein